MLRPGLIDWLIDFYSVWCIQHRLMACKLYEHYATGTGTWKRNSEIIGIEFLDTENPKICIFWSWIAFRVLARKWGMFAGEPISWQRWTAMSQLKANRFLTAQNWFYSGGETQIGPTWMKDILLCRFLRCLPFLLLELVVVFGRYLQV